MCLFWENLKCSFIYNCLSQNHITFLENVSPPKPLDVCWCMVKVKVKGQIMYFLVNVSPPKPLDVATSNFAGA